MDLTKLTSDEFDRFRVFIYEETGIRLADGKITLLSNRIRRRLRELDIELFEEYYNLLTQKKLKGEIVIIIEGNRNK